MRVTQERGKIVDTFDKDFAAGLLEAYEPPCLSLYQRTHRHRPENQQDPIRFGNLVKSLEESLLRKYPKREIQTLLDPFLALAEDRDFWEHTLDGLAVLGGRGVFRGGRVCLNSFMRFIGDDLSVMQLF